MSRLVPSLVALATAAALTGPALSADWGEGLDMRGPMLSTEPKDWTDLGNEEDSMEFEFGVRYWYSWGAQSFTSGGGTTTETDVSHSGEVHARIEDNYTRTFAKLNVGYSFITTGSYTGPILAGTVGDGHIGYAGADLGWNAFGDDAGTGAGILVGYNYWNSAPNTGRNNFTTATSSADITYDPTTGQTFLPGDSAPDHVEIHMLRLGLQGKAELNDLFDVTAEIVAVPYARIFGVMGIDDPTFNAAVYGGPAQLPYAGVANGNISTMRSSPTAIDGWGYGAMGEAWLGVHPTENITVRLGGRAWYLQGTVDATYTAAQIGNPSDADLDGVYDTAPTFTNAGFISTANPFSMMRYGLLAELTYKF